MLPVIRRTKDKTKGNPPVKADQDLFHQRMMKQTIDLSKLAIEDPDVYEPFAALVVRNTDGKVIGEGCNNVRETMDPSMHGVVVAIKRACRASDSLELIGCTLYSSCQPCGMCAYLISLTKIHAVYFAHSGFDQLPGKSVPLGATQEQTISYTQLLEKEANKVIQHWIENQKKEKPVK